MLMIGGSAKTVFPLPSYTLPQRGMDGPDLKRKVAPTGSPSATPNMDDGFVKVEKRKKKRLDKHRPQFQYDTSYFRTGKKIGIAVSQCLVRLAGWEQLADKQHIRDLSLYIAADAQKPSWIVVDVSRTAAIWLMSRTPPMSHTPLSFSRRDCFRLTLDCRL